MKITVYMAQSVNGFIARADGETPWSDAEWKLYKKEIKSQDCLIVGQKTYHSMLGDNGFKKIGNPNVIVVGEKIETTNSHVLVANTKQAINIIKKAGYKKVLIGGGAFTNTQFLKAKLVDEIVLDIESMMFETGIPFISNSGVDIKLKLLKILKYSGGVQLRYKVIE
jgi:dihydrofolate reductase